MIKAKVKVNSVTLSVSLVKIMWTQRLASWWSYMETPWRVEQKTDSGWPLLEPSLVHVWQRVKGFLPLLRTDSFSPQHPTILAQA